MHLHVKIIIVLPELMFLADKDLVLSSFELYLMLLTKNERRLEQKTNKHFISHITVTYVSSWPT